MEFTWKPPPGPASAAGPEGRGRGGGQELLHRRRQTTRRESEAFGSTKRGRCAFGGQRGESGCPHRGRRRIRHPSEAGQGSTPASRLARFAIFSFIIIFYAQRCLREGLSRFSSRPASLRVIADRRTVAMPLHESPPTGGLHGGGEPARRLAGEKLPGASSDSRDTRSADEDALCSAIESFAQARRAVAAETLTEESDEDAGSGPSTQPTSMENREATLRETQEKH